MTLYSKTVCVGKKNKSYSFKKLKSQKKKRAVQLFVQYNVYIYNVGWILGNGDTTLLLYYIIHIAIIERTIILRGCYQRAYKHGRSNDL